MNYNFKLPIGDWSGDGHGQKEYLLIESNKPVEEVRELYFQACDKVGFSLDGSYKTTDLTPFAEYEDATFKKQTLKTLLEFGVKLKEETIELIEEIIDDEDYFEKDIFVEIILEFIKTQDKSLTLVVISEKEFPMLSFYGTDEKNRHIGYFGYGLFSDY